MDAQRSPLRGARACGLAAVVLAVAAAGGCRHSGRPAADVVAVVDGEAIVRATFDVQVERSLERFARGPTPLPGGIVLRLQESVLGRMIDDLILAHKARGLGIEVTDEEVGRQLEATRARFASPEAFAEHLARTHQSEVALRDDLRRGMVQDRVVERLVGDFAVAEADVERYYEENLARFKEPEQIRARRLLLRLPADATPGQSRAKLARAEGLVQRARRRPGDFAKLAAAQGEGPEREAKGDLGGFFPRGRLSPAFDAAAFELAAEEISDPFVSPLGVEVVQLLERREARTRPLAEVQSGLRASLTARAHNDRRREVLQHMRQAARIERLVSFDEPAVAAPTPG